MDSHQSFSRRQMIWLAVVCLVAIGLRCVALDRSYWLDEVATLLNIDSGGIGSVLVATAHDNQPPLYNLTAFAWTRLFGESEIAVRSLSLLCGLLALATPWLARRSLGTGEKLVNFAILCCMSYPIRYAQEARNYSLMLLMASVCVYVYYEINVSRDRSLQRVLYPAIALLAFTHIFGTLLALSFLAVMWWRESSWPRRAGLAALGVALAAAALGPLLWAGAAKQAGGNFWIQFGPKVVVVELLKLFTPVGLLLLGYGLFRWRRAPQRRAIEPALAWTLLPFAMLLAGSLAISLHTPIFLAHYLIGLIPAFALLTGWLWRPAVSGTRPAVVLAGLSLLMVQAVVLTFSPYLFVQENLREIARISLAHDRPACYVTPTGVKGEPAVWSYYITRRFGRPDLKPIVVPEAQIASVAASGRCELWAEGHLMKRGSTVLKEHSELAQCRELPLGRPGRAMATALVDCDPVGGKVATPPAR